MNPIRHVQSFRRFTARHTRSALILTALGAGALPQAGCWQAEREEVLKATCDFLMNWHTEAWQRCNALPEPLRTQCLADLESKNNTVSAKKVEAMLAYKNCNEEVFKGAVQVIVGIVTLLTEFIKKNFGDLFGEAGTVNVAAGAQGQGGNYQLLPGSQVQFSFGTGPINTGQLQGVFALSLQPDPVTGGFVGTVDQFQVVVNVDQVPPTQLVRHFGPVPSEVHIDAAGHGVMGLHVRALNDFLGNIVMWVEIPIQGQPPQFNQLQISTGGPVSGRVVLPVIAAPPAGDCNQNGIPDNLDILTGLSDDCDLDGVPDECQIGGADCNGNGVLDSCDIASGVSHDLNHNTFPDECEGCYANCDGNTDPKGHPILNINDFICFQTKFALGDTYADCDGNDLLNINDFICFQTSFALGCT